MYRCEFCGAELPALASFCGACGHMGPAPAQRDAADYPTQASDLPAVHTQNAGGSVYDSTSGESVIATFISTPDATFISTPDHTPVQWQGAPVQESHAPAFDPDTPTMALSTEEDEEEKRRRAALLGFAIPLVGSFGLEGQPQSAAPMVQGTPQAPGVPSVSGTPSMPGAPSMPGTPSMPGIHPSPGPSLPTTPPPQAPNSLGQEIHPWHPQPPHTPHPVHPQHGPHHHQPHPHPHPHPHPKPHAPHKLPLLKSGWVTWVTVGGVAFLIIVASIIGLGFAFWTPGISLSGGSIVAPGGTLALHGHGFLPHSSVSLTIDGGIPLYIARRNVPLQVAYSENAGAITGITQQTLTPGTSNVASADGSGSFTVSVLIDSIWSLGKHTIHATESLSHRSIALDFTIYDSVPPSPTPTTPAGSDTPTPSATATGTPTPTPTGTPTLAPTPTATSIPGVPSLSCVNPGTLTLGPVVQGSIQPVSAKATLCATGSGTVNWSATWTGATWLQLDHTSGQIASPGQALVTVSAAAGALVSGTYTAAITFSGQPGTSTQTLQVSFTVSASPPCVTAAPAALSFTGVAGVSDPPAAKTITVTNCGKTSGTWSATATTVSGGKWLTISPATGTLAAGALGTISVTASNLSATLAAGTYTGTVTVSSGTSTASVAVTLTVQAPPPALLTVSPSSIFANAVCTGANNWVCTVTVTNTSATQSLTWSATSSGISGITFAPAGGTIPAGQNVQVTVTVPANNCTATVTLTFTGPANSVPVPWTCTIIG